jgi:hypothetical protein
VVLSVGLRVMGVLLRLGSREGKSDGKCRGEVEEADLSTALRSGRDDRVGVMVKNE